MGEGWEKKEIQTGREANHKRLLNSENKLKVNGGGGERKWVMGIEEGSCWDEHWVLYVSQFDNKLYLKINKKSSCVYNKIAERTENHEFSCSIRKLRSWDRLLPQVWRMQKNQR